MAFFQCTYELYTTGTPATSRQIRLLMQPTLRQRHQNPDMGYTHRKSAAVSTSKQTRKTLELLRACYNRQNCADVLPESRKVPQSARCRPENHARRSIGIASRSS